MTVPKLRCYSSGLLSLKVSVFLYIIVETLQLSWQKKFFVLKLHYSLVGQSWTGLNWRLHGCLEIFQMKYHHLKSDVKTKFQVINHHADFKITKEIWLRFILCWWIHLCYNSTTFDLICETVWRKERAVHFDPVLSDSSVLQELGVRFMFDITIQVGKSAAAAALGIFSVWSSQGRNVFLQAISSHSDVASPCILLSNLSMLFVCLINYFSCNLITSTSSISNLHATPSVRQLAGYLKRLPTVQR